MSPARETGVPPHLLVVFGGTGDLARRKLLPAVKRLWDLGVEGAGLHVLGVGRHHDLGEDGFRRLVREALDASGAAGAGGWCESCVHYHAAAAADGELGELRPRIEAIEREADLPGNRTFYLAVPPSAFESIVEGLGSSGLVEGPGFARLTVEKPFGHDLSSARELNEQIHRWFPEREVFRIDHYLGKETVQNLLVLRFANSMLESLWNRGHVDDVQITVSETLGIGGRSGYYDDVGVVRDMIQNHLTQLLALIAMELPAAYEPEAVRNEKEKVLRAVRPLQDEDVVLGQYGPGRSGDRDLPGYSAERGVRPGSRAPTYAAVRLWIDNWRWEGVPFYLRTGKRLAQDLTEIAVTFRRPPVHLFEGSSSERLRRDVLRIRLQPDEGFSLDLDVKRPGGPFALEKVPLEFRYGSRFGPLPDAYVTLLQDVARGDPTLFVSAAEAELAWKLYGPLLVDPLPVLPYPAGSWGPAEADRLPAREGVAWRSPA